MGNARVACLGAFVLLLPVSVEIPAARDSGRVGAETRVGVYGGVGHYALVDRGCEGEILRTHPRDFHEVGGELQQRIPGGLTIGARAGTVRLKGANTIEYGSYPLAESLQAVRGTTTYVNPTVGLDAPPIGLGVGVIMAREPQDIERNHHIDGHVSYHVRLGSLDHLYLEVSSLESVPLYSGGGNTEVALGMHPHRLWDMVVGIGGGPYDGPGLVVKIDRRILDHHALALRTRLGNSGGENQSGVALGWSYVSSMPMDPPPPRPGKRGKPFGSAWGLGPREPKKAPGQESQEPPQPSPAITPTSPARPPLHAQRDPEFGVYEQVDSLPEVIRRVEPVRTDSTTTGTVTLSALIDAEGGIKDVRILRSIPALDQAAIECVRQWRFRPAIRDGAPVPYWLAIPLSFPP